MQTRPFKAIDATTLGAARTTLEPLLRQLNGPLQDISQALSRNLTLGDNLAVMLKTVTVTVPDPWVTWGASDLSNGWTILGIPNNAPGYRKSADGSMAMLRGRIASGTLAATVANLPAAYAPSADAIFVVRAASSTGSVKVTSAGAITVPDGATTDVFLWGVQWPCADPTPIALSCWPVVLSWDLPGQCIGVVPLSVYVLDPVNKGVPLANVSACSALPSWQQASAAGKPQIKILNQPMLAPGKSYSITYACFAG